MTIDFTPGETEAAVADALAALCRQHCTEALVRDASGTFPQAFWLALAEFGLFALGVPDGVGGAVEVAAAGEVLGRFVAPGPLAAAVFAMQILPEPARQEVMSGAAVVSEVMPPFAPWPDVASIFLATDGREAWLLDVDVEARAATLGAEPWARIRSTRAESLGDCRRASAMQDIFLAAYLAAAARKLVGDASAYVATRRQFGKTLSQFQAVSHPLAEVAIRARAASVLARIAASELDLQSPEAGVRAASARISAEAAALQATSVCHQSFGATGITVDGPVFYISRRLRHMVNLQGAALSVRLQEIERSYRHAPDADLRVVIR